MRTTIQLDIECERAGWNQLAQMKTRLSLAAAATSAKLPQSLQGATRVALLLTGDRRMRELNRSFRQKDSSTNVLSFPQFAPKDLKAALRSQNHRQTSSHTAASTASSRTLAQTLPQTLPRTPSRNSLHSFRSLRSLRTPLRDRNEVLPEEALFLGDIAMAWQTVKTEAERDAKTVIDHATHLVIHGLLHLYGYDHLRENEAEKMEAMEIAIMQDLGLKNPYLAPTASASAKKNVSTKAAPKKPKNNSCT